MNRFMESLEPRRLMSVASATVLKADAAAASADATAVRAAVAAVKSVAAKDRAVLTTDVKRAEAKADRAANARLLATFTRAETTALTQVNAAANALSTVARSAASAGVGQGRAVATHPTTAAAAKVTATIGVLTTTVPARVSAVDVAAAAALTAIDAAAADIVTALPAVGAIVPTGEADLSTTVAAVETAAGTVATGAAKEAVDLGAAPATPAVTLTGATLFRADTTGDNVSAGGGVITRGAWTSGLDVQNVPGNYAAELFISRVANPTAADFLTPGTLAASLVAGANTFYFFADGDDTAGGAATFGLNLFLNGAGGTVPTVSGYVAPGAGQTVAADGAVTTSAVSLAAVPGSGTLTTAVAAAGTAPAGMAVLTAFTVLGVGGSTSTVDLVNSTNTVPFSPPAHADGVTDTYGTFVVTVTA